MAIRIKRIYETAAKGDGVRVLVDRLWPRGVRKDEAQIDLWLKEIAPSTALRQWFGHNPARWGKFKEKYFTELKDNQGLLEGIREMAKNKSVTLLYSAKDIKHNNAKVIQEYLHGGNSDNY